jgi:hypothetical protein
MARVLVSSVCNSPLQSALAALTGGVVGLLAGLGAVETAVLAGLVAGVVDLSVGVARGDLAVEPLRAALRSDAQ